MDKNEIKKGRIVIEAAIMENTRKRDSELLEGMETIRNQSKKQKTKTTKTKTKTKKTKTNNNKKKKGKNNTDADGSVSTIHTNDPPMIKTRKANIRRNRKRLEELGLVRNPKMSEKKKKKVVEKVEIEATEVVKILQHRKFKNGKTKIKILWNNNETEWHDDIDAVKVDFPEIVNDYFNNMEEEIVTNKFFKYSDEDSFVCGINHDNYNIGITYKEEPDHGYWIDGASMEGVTCSSCNGNFTLSSCKPTNVKPAYTCVNRVRGCCICYCNNCFNKKMEQFLKSSSGVRQRRIRSKK